MKIKGFTLAEILITLAIIGVVATLTIPGTIKNYRTKVLTTQLQNTINLVANAVSQAMDDNAAENFRDIVSNKSAQENFLQTYFDTVNLCDKETTSGNCLADVYTSFDKSQEKTRANLMADVGPGVKVCAVLASGATICIWPNFVSSAETLPVGFMIDINGVESPNIASMDLHTFYIGENGKIKSSSTVENIVKYNYCGSDTFALDCLPLIISKGWKFLY